MKKVFRVIQIWSIVCSVLLVDIAYSLNRASFIVDFSNPIIAQEIALCCDNYKSHIMVPTKFLGIDLKDLLNLFISCYEESDSNKLPEELITCHHMLQSGSHTVHAYDLTHALSFITEKLIGELHKVRNEELIQVNDVVVESDMHMFETSENSLLDDLLLDIQEHDLLENNSNEENAPAEVFIDSIINFIHFLTDLVNVFDE